MTLSCSHKPSILWGLDLQIQLHAKSYSFLYSFHNFRNRSKGGAFLPTHLACLLAKTTLDCVSRLLLFSTWMYVLNEGQFSTGMTVGAYYATFTLLLVFHAIFNKNINFWSAKNLIGMYIYSSLTFKMFSLKFYPKESRRFYSKTLFLFYNFQKNRE